MSSINFSSLIVFIAFFLYCLQNKSIVVQIISIFNFKLFICTASFQFNHTLVSAKLDIDIVIILLFNCLFDVKGLINIFVNKIVVANFACIALSYLNSRIMLSYSYWTTLVQYSKQYSLGRNVEWILIWFASNSY